MESGVASAQALVGLDARHAPTQELTAAAQAQVRRGAEDDADPSSACVAQVTAGGSHQYAAAPPSRDAKMLLLVHVPAALHFSLTEAKQHRYRKDERNFMLAKVPQPVEARTCPSCHALVTSAMRALRP